jgi:hypothetical protein
MTGRGLDTQALRGPREGRLKWPSFELIIPVMCTCQIESFISIIENKFDLRISFVKYNFK